MKKNSEISRMFSYAGNRHWLTILGMILAGLSTVLSMGPFVCIWFVVRDLLTALAAGDMGLAANSGVYAWWAVGFSVLSTEELKILLSVYRYLGLPPEVISILINYCIQKNRARANPR